MRQIPLSALVQAYVLGEPPNALSLLGMTAILISGAWAVVSLSIMILGPSWMWR
jgi:hypothetical protein